MKTEEEISAEQKALDKQIAISNAFEVDNNTLRKNLKAANISVDELKERMKGQSVHLAFLISILDKMGIEHSLRPEWFGTEEFGLNLYRLKYPG